MMSPVTIISAGSRPPRKTSEAPGDAEGAAFVQHALPHQERVAAAARRAVHALQDRRCERGSMNTTVPDRAKRVAGFAQVDAIDATRTGRQAQPDDAGARDSAARAMATASSGADRAFAALGTLWIPRGDGETLPKAATTARPASG